MEKRAREFLHQLSGMKEEEVSCYFLGNGSTRDAYIFEDNFVIKIPRFVVCFKDANEYKPERILKIIKNGVRQTNKEISVYSKCNDRLKYLLNPIVAYGHFLNMPFVVMPKIKIASKVVPFDVANIKDFLLYYDLCVPRTFFRDILSLACDYGLCLSDLEENTDNFGIDSSNHLLLTDYGTKNEGVMC